MDTKASNNDQVSLNELTSKMIKLEEKKTVLEAQMELLLYEKENLKMSMDKQTQELQMYQKASLTNQDQTVSLPREQKFVKPNRRYTRDAAER